MIIATITFLTIYLGGGGTFSFQALEPSFKQAVSEEVTFEQIQTILERVDGELQGFNALLKGEIVENVSTAFKNYDATREEFYKLFDQADAARNTAQQHLIDARFQIRSLMTADEWKSYADDLKTRAEESQGS